MQRKMENVSYKLHLAVGLHRKQLHEENRADVSEQSLSLLMHSLLGSTVRLYREYHSCCYWCYLYYYNYY